MKLRFVRMAAGLLCGRIGYDFVWPPQGRCAVNLYWIGGSSVQYDDGQNWSFYEGANVRPHPRFPAPATSLFRARADISFTSGQPPTPDLLQILMAA